MPTPGETLYVTGARPDTGMGQDQSSLNDTQADRYENLSSGPGLSSSFEPQEGIPYDGSNALARQLSPFTIRVVPPADLLDRLLGEGNQIDVNLLGRATQDSQQKASQLASIRDALGIPTSGMESASDTVLTNLRSTVSAGQYLQSTTGTDVTSVLTDLTTVADIKYQVEVMLQTPPLTLLINPESMSIAYTSTQQFSNRSRHGFLFERWGEAQPTIQFSGTTGAWCAGIDPAQRMGAIVGPSMSGNEPPTGVQFATKRDSAAFQNFISLYQFYRNNGYIYDTVTGTEAHLYIGAIAIDYDQWTYVGHIESFEYGYDEQNPHNIKWSMNFTVGRMYDHAQSPLVVLPESTPVPAYGSLSVSELAELAGSTPQRGDVERHIGEGWVNVSGADSYGRETTIVPGEDGVGEEFAQTPVEAFGTIFTPAYITFGGE